jgi:glycerol-1-phosphate dehydrogenase [NAD(P)+]
MSNELRTDLEAAGRIAADHGREGSIGLNRILIGDDSLDQLPAAVARVTGPGEIVILEDATPMLIGGEDLKSRAAAMLARVGATRRVVLGPPDGALHADASAIAAASEAADGAGCLVSVGSGTLTDVAKEASHRSGVPLVAVQTAASVNGYADGMAVVLKDGVKRTVPSAWPTELLVDTRVLVDAPQTMTRSGFAEMMAMFTAPADWMLAAAVGLDPRYDRDVIGLFRSRGDELLAAAAAVGRGDPDALELLALLLTQSGLAMGAVARTAPLSGTEHVIAWCPGRCSRRDRLLRLGAGPRPDRSGRHRDATTVATNGGGTGGESICRDRPGWGHGPGVLGRLPAKAGRMDRRRPSCPCRRMGIAP